MELLIDQILAENSLIAQHATVRIAGLGGGREGVFTAIFTGTLSFNLGSEWTTISQMTGMANDVTNAGVQTIQGILQQLGLQKQGKTYTPYFAQQYREIWKGPQKPRFAVELLFINYNGEDIRQRIMSLYKTVLPGSNGIEVIEGVKAENLTTPLGYNPQSNTGLLQVNVGKWFRGTQMLVEGIQVNFSKEVVGDKDTQNSTPLFATATVTFMPRDAITYSTFKGYFLNPPNGRA